jgi:hypothetical protein
MPKKEIEVSPLTDVWIVGWMFPRGKQRAQHPHVFVAANSSFRLRSHATWEPLYALVQKATANPKGETQVMPLHQPGTGPMR